jgi:phosphonate transport system substrate-binding protein
VDFMGRFTQALLKSAFIVVLVSCSTPPAATDTPTDSPLDSAVETADGTIVLADITEDPIERIEAFQPLADYLGANLGDYGIGVGEVRIAPDFDTLAMWIANGEVDLYFDSPYPAMILSDSTGAVPLLRRWKEGTAEYHSVIFTLQSSDVDTLDDLNGDLIAFEEPVSTSGYMLPLTYLIEAGLTVAEKEGLDAPVGADEVGFVFSGDDENTIQWVLSGQTTAGALDSGAFEELPESTREQLLVLAETETLPRHIVLSNPDMDAGMRDAIIELLLGLDKTDEGKAILATFEETTKFDELPGGAEVAIARMRELYNLTQNAPNERVREWL